MTQRGKSYDINRRVVYHAIESGSGYKGLATFCGIMNMPCLSKPAYYKQVDNILEALEDEAKEDMRKAGERLQQQILEENPEKDLDDTLDAVASFDGTWAKRGFTLLTGVAFVISVDTGEVLDYRVLSKACQKCALKKAKGVNEEEFEEWLFEHECDINFAGSSPAMECEGAVVLWERSVERHNLRYRWMVSDGDSKAFNCVENVYGEIKMKKLDCMGHVQKRMDKHLLNLKARTKGKLADGKPIGGIGRLSDTRIKKFQKDYGLAIRQFVSLVVFVQEWQHMQKTVKDWLSLICRLCRRKRDGVKGSDFRGLVERKPFEKLKESLMNQEAFKLLLDIPVDKI